MTKLIALTGMVFLLSSCEIEDPINGNQTQTSIYVTSGNDVNQEVINDENEVVNEDNDSEVSEEPIVEEEVDQTIYIQEKTTLNNFLPTVPRLYYYDVIVPASTQYQVYVNDDLAVDDVSGVGDLVGPASGLRSSHARISQAVYVVTSGAQEISVVQGAEKQSLAFEIAEQACQTNESFFTQYVQSKLSQCLACHSDSSNNSAPYSFETFDDVAYYISGHTNMLSTQPTKSYHGGGERFAENDVTSQAIQILEYRVDNNWMCL